MKTEKIITIKDIIQKCNIDNVKKIWEIKYKYKDLSDVYPLENLSFYIENLIDCPTIDTNRVLTIKNCSKNNIFSILSENGSDISYKGNLIEWLNYKVIIDCKLKYSNDEIASYLLWLLIGI
jgi:hypothetical protein